LRRTAPALSAGIAAGGLTPVCIHIAEDLVKDRDHLLDLALRNGQ
jgi:hypothetical protein